jgi:hypothetical protein
MPHAAATSSCRGSTSRRPPGTGCSLAHPCVLAKCRAIRHPWMSTGAACCLPSWQCLRKNGYGQISVCACECSASADVHHNNEWVPKLFPTCSMGPNIVSKAGCQRQASSETKSGPMFLIFEFRNNFGTRFDGTYSLETSLGPCESN